MSDLDSLVTVTVSVTSASPAQANFGTPLLFAHHTIGTGGARVATFSDLDEVVTAGHVIGSSVYAKAAKIFAQNPRPSTLKVGRRSTATTQVIHFLPTALVIGKIYKITVTGVLTYTASFTAADTVLANISTGIKAALDALSIPGLTVTIDGGTSAVVCTAAATKFFTYSQVSDWLDITDASAATNFASDFALVTAETDDWYAVVCDMDSAAVITAMAAVIETRHKLYVSDIADSAVADSGSTTDIAYLMKAAAYRRTYLQYTRQPGICGAAGLMARQLTQNPGSSNWAWKEIAGVAVDTIGTTDQTDVAAKNANYYVSKNGLNVTFFGKSAQGEYLDVMQGCDWIVARCQERIAALFASNEKVAFTDTGIELIGNEIRAVLKTAATDDYKIIEDGTQYVTLPKASSFTGAERLSRILSNVKFGGNLQGAINQARLAGRLAV